MSQVQKSTAASSGELSDKQLDAVAGGGDQGSGSAISAGSNSGFNLGTQFGDGGSSLLPGTNDPLASGTFDPLQSGGLPGGNIGLT